MVTKQDLQKMFNPLPETIKKRYLDRVLTQMETAKEERDIFLYIVRMLYHDFVKPVDMMTALSKFVSSEENLGTKHIALGTPEILLTDKDKLISWLKIRTHFFKVLDELGLKDEFRDLSEISFDFLKGEK